MGIYAAETGSLVHPKFFNINILIYYSHYGL